MRASRFAIIALAVALLAPTASATAASMGGKCAKVGATATSGGKSLVCSKSGKKLLWKVVAAPKTVQLPPVVGPDPDYTTLAFYYGWYSNPGTDGRWDHWDQNRAAPPGDIGSDYYPQLGAYSSRDPLVVAQHMAWLRQAGIGVIALSWWFDSANNNMAQLVLDTAAKYGIKVTFHLEPANPRLADRYAAEVEALVKRFGSHPAFFKTTQTSLYVKSTTSHPMIFVWCSAIYNNAKPDLVPTGYWKAANDAIHASTNALLIADPCNGDYAGMVNEHHFDGGYNYITLHLKDEGYFNWARSLPPGALYVPSVAPGNEAERVGYEASTLMPRRAGANYDEQWAAALDAGIAPAMVSITSFNEWHEGSMLEPAKQGFSAAGRTYKDFGALDPTYYLTRTKHWIDIKNAKTYPATLGKRLRLTVSSTSDWANLKLQSGDLFQPVPVACASSAEISAYTGTEWRLNQSIEKANAGNVMQLCYDITVASTSLTFVYDGGAIGSGSVLLQAPQADGTFATLQQLTWVGNTDGGKAQSATIS